VPWSLHLSTHNLFAWLGSPYKLAGQLRAVTQNPVSGLPNNERLLEHVFSQVPIEVADNWL
jgi:hypothetical protein